jgi:predicted cupin superfamily sugar epimerase
MSPTATRFIALLGLVPLPLEGGFFRRTWTAGHALAPPCLPPGVAGERPIGSAILYLLTADSFSALHRLPTDEVYHFYLGDPVELVQLDPDGRGQRHRLGSDPFAGLRVQTVVPAGAWQGARLEPGGEYALMGTTLAPAFADTDLELGRRERLEALYPAWRDAIHALTDP